MHIPYVNWIGVNGATSRVWNYTLNNDEGKPLVYMPFWLVEAKILRCMPFSFMHTLYQYISCKPGDTQPYFLNCFWYSGAFCIDCFSVSVTSLLLNKCHLSFLVDCVALNSKKDKSNCEKSRLIWKCLYTFNYNFSTRARAHLFTLSCTICLTKSGFYVNNIFPTMHSH